MHIARLLRLPAAFVACCLANGTTTPIHAAPARAPLSFNRDIRPILAEACFECHGPDSAARKSELRLDQPEPALKGGKSGAPAIVPGSPERSQLVTRLETQDEDDRMPPPASGKTLSPSQTETLREWIRQGATWEVHWAFQKPMPSPVPSRSKHDERARHPIDAFIGAGLLAWRMNPSPEADRPTLIRRLSLDLTGLPPSPEAVRTFVEDTRPDAWDRQVDRLLASPHFGERWGRHWLDLARYADSDGYERDSPRPHAWLYRDWVIRAVNQDLPFDQFTLQQLAGDLLPEAGEAAQTATGFHRQTLINKEGGVDPEEFRCKATVDRAHTTAAVWTGLTLGCAECHDHKFDPITQEEFYAFYAFFNNASDRQLPLPTEGEIASHAQATNRWQLRLHELTAELAALPPEPTQAEAGNEPLPEEDGGKSQASREGETASETTPARLKKELAKHRQSKPVFQPTTAAVLGAEARETFVHVRGDFLQKGARVQPGTFAFLPPLRARGEPPDRLDLARWLVSDENPLTARVAVNHVWRHLFGRGLVATENDFGTRGDPPSHPELLDWLSVAFQSPTNQPFGLAWSRKALIRLIVTSAAYRQSSAWRADTAERDPLNNRLARQGRFRVEAEIVRDIALAASGLLSGTVGGPSFKPPLAPDLAKLNYANGLDWKAATGDQRYRRGMYIHFQRTVPFPMLMAFDAPESNLTCTRRERSTSPLQALTLLNNETFFECAQALGRRLSRRPGGFEDRLSYGFQLATGRPPTAEEQSRLHAFWTGHYTRFHSSPEDAWIACARVLLNLDETITRE